MAGWTTHEGRAVVLGRDNIDTDQLIPARFMSTPRSEGYGGYLLHDMRQREDGTPDPDFPLNQSPDASILIAGRNFGSGSSREAAVYALVDAGIRAVLAPSFGDIFASNAVNNGLLPARLSDEDAEALARIVRQTGETVGIDLQERSITVAEHMFHFDLPDNWRTKLINGWDDIDLTLQHADAIRGFRNERYSAAPWARPGGTN
jgi:3-isopropylmalate/(R)-2-methylmalate dehydratase small subunit